MWFSFWAIDSIRTLSACILLPYLCIFQSLDLCLIENGMFIEILQFPTGNIMYTVIVKSTSNDTQKKWSGKTRKSKMLNCAQHKQNRPTNNASEQQYIILFEKWANTKNGKLSILHPKLLSIRTFCWLMCTGLIFFIHAKQKQQMATSLIQVNYVQFFEIVAVNFRTATYSYNGI